MPDSPSHGKSLATGSGPARWFLGGLLTWKAVGAETSGRYEIVEQLGPRGFAAPLHTHGQEAEGFYVLEGEVTFVREDEKTRAGPGTFIFIPPTRRHAFRVDSPVARFLTIISPSGLQAFFEELSEPAAAPTLPPPTVVPASVDSITAVAGRYRLKILGPPPEEGP